MAYRWLAVPLTLALVASAFSLARAQHSDPLNTCLKTAMTQYAINGCASDDAKRADKEMADIYAKLLKRASAIRGATALVRRTQDDWLAYRKAYAAASFPFADKQFEYGELYGMHYSLSLAKLTRRHVEELRDLYDALGPCPFNPRC